jgi:hypothetical protein
MSCPLLVTTSYPGGFREVLCLQTMNDNTVDCYGLSQYMQVFVPGGVRGGDDKVTHASAIRCRAAGCTPFHP